jgi:hypothetical protein
MRLLLRLKNLLKKKSKGRNPNKSVLRLNKELVDQSLQEVRRESNKLNGKVTAVKVNMMIK